MTSASECPSRNSHHHEGIRALGVDIEVVDRDDVGVYQPLLAFCFSGQRGKCTRVAFEIIRQDLDRNVVSAPRCIAFCVSEFFGVVNLVDGAVDDAHSAAADETVQYVAATLAQFSADTNFLVSASSFGAMLTRWFRFRSLCGEWQC